MRHFISSLLAFGTLSFLGAACLEDEAIRPVPEAVVAIYGDPHETSLVPFPSDRLTVADPTTRTGLRVDVTSETTGDVLVVNYGAIAKRFGELDGFATSGGFAAGFTGPLDGSGFSGPQGGKTDREIDPTVFIGRDSPVVLIDIDERSPERGRVVPIIPRYYAQADDGYYVDEYAIVARPLEPLAPRRRYLFAVTTALRGENGVPVARSPGTKSFLANLDGPYGAMVDGGLTVLTDATGIPRGEVVLVSAFTTESVNEELFALAGAVRASPPPDATTAWEIETAPTETDPRVRFSARFRAPEYRGPDGTFVVEGGVPVKQGSAELELFLAFSDSTVSGRRPVVIYQHGLGGDKGGSWGTVGRLAELGVAVIAIDSPEHGYRGDAGGDQLSSVLGFFGIDRETLAFDLGKVRDNFRQMAADQLELVRFMSAAKDLDLLPIGAPDGVPDLDVSQFLYIGHSFGSVQGPTIFALAPEIKHAVWNVGGDSVMQLIEDSATFRVLVDGIKPDYTSDGQLARFFSASQAIAEAGDPINFARFALREDAPFGAPAGRRSVLVQEVMNDNIVPNSSTEILARALGLSQMDSLAPVPGLEAVSSPTSGNARGGSTGVLAQFDRMNGAEVATHGELIFSEEARRQYVEFFRTALSDGVGTVIAH